jgi:hypothetical protein
MDKQSERREWTNLMSLLEKLEIKGSTNIYILGNIFGFITEKISKIDEEEKMRGNQ